MWDSIVTTRSTAKLNAFVLITYADLKKFKYFYWFAFPAFVSTPPWHIADPGWAAASFSYSNDQLVSIHAQLAQSAKEDKPLAYFLVTAEENKVLPVEEYAQHPGATIAFIDPSAQPTNPGWPLRNLLAYLRALYPASTSSLKILCWRDAEPPRGDDIWKSRVGTLQLGDGGTVVDAKEAKKPNAVGWEKNVQGKLGPRVADLAPMMDPTRYDFLAYTRRKALISRRLANQAVDLNLKLMRWRILPELNLEKIAETKCLLLGAGTLGCYVARCLMVSSSLFFESMISYLSIGMGRPHDNFSRFCPCILLKPCAAAAVPIHRLPRRG